MAFRIAILYEDNKVFLEFSPEKFIELLKKYAESSKDIEDIVARIVKEIKKETNQL